MRFVTHQNLAAWLDALIPENTVIAPRDQDGVLLYQPIQSSSEINWSFTRPVMSIKAFFFPTTERLMTIERHGQSIRLVETLPAGQTVIFGVRPCDARGVQVLDELFLNTPPVDPYYATRRENTTLIGMACSEMGDTCFCTSVGGSPHDASGMDIMLTETAGGYAIEPITEKGSILMIGLTTDDIPGKLPVLTYAEQISLPAAEEWPRHFASDYWNSVSERCLSCRICAYVCPTCRCFDVRDEALPSSNGAHCYERLRCWDSCTGEAYRKIAGGHNPRAAKADRLRNRFFCKFNYYPDQYGLQACTGCGRCIDACPVNIDITEVLANLAEVSA